MDFDSPDVEKDFPGLYASEGADGKSKKSKDDSDYSETEHDKLSKKDLLIGRRKDKKDKGKDRGYAALEGESSPEEELDAKSPSKSKKTKAFKFTSSKSKEKREKSRDKEKIEKDLRDEDKQKDKEKPEKERDHKKKDKERREKDKKEKSKDKEKEKKDKKSKQASTVSEEVLELGDVQPVFGVSVSLATERSRCHDGIDLPLVIRDCIDYLQEYGLKSDHIYKVEPVKTRLQHFKRLYNNRERQRDVDELDIPTACGLLKMFLRELPEPVLTTDLVTQFEEVASYAQVTKQQEELRKLLDQLPSCNRTLLAWLLLHFDAIIQQEKYNKINAQSLAMLLSPSLQMSHRLLVALLCHCPNLFGDLQLIKYVAPITPSSPKLPENPNDIQIELRKQESLLTQIHSEMNAGFVSKKREEQLWEVQRIITQLKRKLRSFEKRQEKSMDESQIENISSSATATEAKTISKTSINSTVAQPDDDSDGASSKAVILSSETKTIISETARMIEEEAKGENDVIPSNDQEQNSIQQLARLMQMEGLYIDEATGFLMLPKTHPDYANLIRLQLETQELIAWKTQLQARITNERRELLRLKQMHLQNIEGKKSIAPINDVAESDYEQYIEHYLHENALLENKMQLLAKEVKDERHECIKMQVELNFQQRFAAT